MSAHLLSELQGERRVQLQREGRTSREISPRRVLRAAPSSPVKAAPRRVFPAGPARALGYSAAYHRVCARAGRSQTFLPARRQPAGKLMISSILKEPLYSGETKDLRPLAESIWDDDKEFSGEAGGASQETVEGLSDDCSTPTASIPSSARRAQYLEKQENEQDEGEHSPIGTETQAGDLSVKVARSGGVSFHMRQRTEEINERREVLTKDGDRPSPEEIVQSFQCVAAFTPPQCEAREVSVVLRRVDGLNVPSGHIPDLVCAISRAQGQWRSASVGALPKQEALGTTPKRGAAPPRSRRGPLVASRVTPRSRLGSRESSVCSARSASPAREARRWLISAPGVHAWCP